MKKLLIFITVLSLMSCSKKQPESVDNNLISNPSFEDANGFSFQDWNGALISSSTDTPSNGENYALQIEPGWAPSEGFAETSISNIQGTVSLHFSCEAKAIDWTGRIIILKENQNGDRTEIRNITFDNTQWQNISFDINTTMNNTDVLIVHLSAGACEITYGYVLFDNVVLTD